MTGTPRIRPIVADDDEASSADLLRENIERLREIFPEAFTEGKVDFEVLKQLLGDAVDEREEKYMLNWHGKRRARQLALTPSTGTLRPCPDESVDWDTTQNLMIEGDNLEVLKLLQKSYANEVKLIYIDPPYNTGADRIYVDDYADSIGAYLQRTGQAEGGSATTSNPESSGRFHTDWLNMMYPRLTLARDLLRADGVILVSIDEREVSNLRQLLAAVFGEENAIGTLIWKGATDNNPTQIAVEHEYLLCFGRTSDARAVEWKNSAEDAKTILLAEYARLKLNTIWSTTDLQKELRSFIRAHRESLAAVTHYDRVDDNGVYTGSRKVHNPKPGGYVYDVVHPQTGKPCVAPVNGYRYPKERMSELIAADRILFGEDETQIIQIKEYLDDYRGKLSSVIHLDSRSGANELRELFKETKLFPNPKPVALLREIFDFLLAPDDDVVDFFAGSGSTMHAVFELNARDGGQRRCTLVQLPELLDDARPEHQTAVKFCKNESLKGNLAELTKERLRRAGANFRSNGIVGDLGFRVFKLDSSNITTWDADSSNLETSLLKSLDHLKADRSEQDVLYEILLKLGLDLCVPIDTRTIANKKVHSIGAGALIACLTVKIELVDVEPLAYGIAEWHKELAPAADTECVFRDSAFVDDVAKSNLAAILEQHGIKKVRSL